MLPEVVRAYGPVFWRKTGNAASSTEKRVLDNSEISDDGGSHDEAVRNPLLSQFCAAHFLMDSNNDEALDIIITNVVATFRTRCHLNLRTIALEGINVIYKPEVGKVLMKLRKPKITATIWSSGKIICTGATSEVEAKLGARRLARCLQKLGFKVRFSAFKVVNVLAVCSMPFAIHLIDFTKNNRPIVSYEPELHPAATYRIKHLKATIQVFSTGSITVTGPNVQNVATAVEQVYPLLFECKKPICK